MLPALPNASRCHRNPSRAHLEIDWLLWTWMVCLGKKTNESNGKMNEHHEIYLTSWRHDIFMSSLETIRLEEFTIKESLQLGGVRVQLKCIYIWMENTLWKKKSRTRIFYFVWRAVGVMVGLLQASPLRLSQVSLMCLMGLDICKRFCSVPLTCIGIHSV